MANIQFTISPAPGITNDLIAVLYKTTAPAAEITRILKEAPHPDPYNFEFTDLESGVYIVKIHESPDGTTLGNLRHDFWVDAGINRLEAYSILDVVVDRGNGAPNYDPSDEDDEYPNEDLKDKTYLVFKPGFGALVWDYHIEKLTDPDTSEETGGFKFINGQAFGSGEEYTILISNLVETASTVASGKSFPEDTYQIFGDTTFSSAFYNKLVEVNSGNTIVTINIADLTTIPDGTKFTISTMTGVQRYVTLQLPTGKYCIVNFVQRNAVYIGRGETLSVMKKGDYLHVIHWEGDHRRVGDIVYSGALGGANKLALTGGWVLKTDYPRLFNWYVNVLDPGELGTGTQDVTPDTDNKTKWVIGTTKFWVPDHRELHYRTAGGSTTPGTYQPDQVGQFVFSGTIMQKSGTNNRHVVLANINDTNLGTQNVTFNSGNENRVKNVAQKAYVII
jgi:hypothetical protein